MEISEIIEQISTYSCGLVEITGGEPLLQKDTPTLIKKLLEKKYDVLMETNGSQDIHLADNRCIKIVDMKCPSSNESEQNDLDNLDRLSQKDQVKFVIGNQKDFQYALKIVNSIRKDFPRGNILFSPVSGKMNPHELAEWILKEALNVRLQLQLHKILWPDIDKGV